jgi:hypothetical protein
MSDHPIFLSRLMLPIAWELLDRAPSVEALKAADRSNEAILEFLLHSIDLDAAARPADEKLAEALAPLRVKLDLAIAMLRRLSYRDVQLPSPSAVDLGLTRMAWHSPQALRPTQWLRIKIYFDATFLEPVILYGQVASCVADGVDGGCNAQAELAEIPQGTGEALARLAFLAQRRELAHRSLHRWER